MTLREEWQKLCSNHTKNDAVVAELWQEIQTAYGASGRHYHGLQHLSNLLALAAGHETMIEQADLFRFAVFYHDIIYNPFAKDNEEKSAALAVQRLQQLGLSQQAQTRVQQMILATKSHVAAGDPDTALLLDFDLSILGSSWLEYQEYSRQVRKEYSLVPFFLYRKGRKKVLLHFLEQENIYKTAQLASRWEVAARRNLQQELDQLR